MSGALAPDPAVVVLDPRCAGADHDPTGTDQTDADQTARPVPGWSGPQVLVLPADAQAPTGAAVTVVRLGDRVAHGAALQAGMAATRGPAVVVVPAGATHRIDRAGVQRACVVLSADPGLDAVVAPDRGGVAVVRRGAVLGLDWAGWTDADTPVRTALRTLGATVREHTGLATNDGPHGGTTDPTGPADPSDPVVLVVTEQPPLAGTRLAALLESWMALWPASRVTVLTPVAVVPAAGRALTDALGLPLVTGADGPRWLAGHADTVELVLLTSVEVEHRMFDTLSAAALPATRVLVAPPPATDAVGSMLGTVDDPDERAGIHTVTAVLRERLAETLHRVDGAWCASERDAGTVRSLRPLLPVAVVPDGVVLGRGAAPARRHGIVVDAERAHDPTTGADEGARAAVEDLLPALHTGAGATALTVLSSRPSPALLALAEQPHVHLERHDRHGALAAARVLVVPQSHGSAARAALVQALRVGTPLLVAAGSDPTTELLDLAPDLVCADLEILAARTRALLRDDATWLTAQDRVLTLGRARGRSALCAALVAAASACGVAPPPAARAARAAAHPAGDPVVTGGPGGGTPPMLAIEARHGQLRVRPAAPPPVPVQAGRVRRDLALARAYHAEGGARQLLRRTTSRAQRLAGQRGLTASAHVPAYDAQYRLLVASRRAGTTHPAPATERVDAPTVSVVIPVYEPDATVLGETVASIRAQDHPHWQLVLSDDASPSPQVRPLLERLAATDERIQVVLNERNGGISAATNAGLAVATGDFVAFCDHDDLLKPDALAVVVRAVLDGREAGAEPDVLYSDEDKSGADGLLSAPFFKPSWSPNLFLSRNYLNHLTVVRRALVEQVGGLRSRCDGSQDYDLLLRVTEVTDRVHHLPEVLYTWRQVDGSTADVVDAKPYAFDAAKRALTDAMARRGVAAEVEDGLVPSTYRVRYRVVGQPVVTVVIPTRDRVDLLRRCIDSVLETSTYRRVRLLVVDNDSRDPETLGYLAELQHARAARVVRYPHRFNYARMMNLGAMVADTDQLLFLNNDTTVIAPDWIEALLEHSQRPEVGAVGGRLFYPGGAIQHEGVAVNYAGGAAGNVDHGGWWSSGEVVHDVSAVTGAVTMMRPDVFAEVGGFEDRLRVAFNDVDLCLRVRQAGYDVVYTPYCSLYHHESASRGVRPHLDDDAFFEGRWRPSEYRDPFYNPNLDRSRPFQVYARGDAPAGWRTDATGEHGTGLRAGAVLPTEH